ncbi:MAG: hypothetical protein V1779_15185 [bacterium]
MAKRMTDSNKWKDPWFKKLPTPYKLLWLYILDDCDHAGLWFVDFEVAQIRIGLEIDILLDEALDLFNCKIIPFDNGDKWFIPSYISFQYGKLNPINKVHLSVQNILLENNLMQFLDNSHKPLPRPLEAPKDKDMDKDNFIDKDIDKVKKNFAKNDQIKNSEIDSEKLFSIFKDFHELYPGKRRKLEIEFENFKKKNENWKEIIPFLIHAIQKEETLRKKAKQNNEFFPEPKYLSTWINKRCWLNEFDDEINKPPTTAHQSPAIDYQPLEEELIKPENPGSQFLFDSPPKTKIEVNDGRKFIKISDEKFVEVDNQFNEFYIKDFYTLFKTYLVVPNKDI